jgi:hypothetical protein
MDKAPPAGVQTWIHYMEEGAGKILALRFLIGAAWVGVAVIFLIFESRNFSAPEAMDMAQLARNIAEGRGYTTWNIRPLSLHLAQQVDVAKGGDGKRLLFKPHPDLANPPVYPYLLGGVMRILPANFRSGAPAAPVALHRPPPEIAINAVNVGVFGLVMLVLWRFALRWTTRTGGVLACLTLFGSFTVWTYVCSGLPTTLLWLWLLLLADLLMRFDRASQEEPARGGLTAVLAAGAGAVCGISALTQYAAGVLVLPAAVFLWASGKNRRWRAAVIAIAAFLVVLSPWVVRNWRLSHTPFGVAGFSLFADTGAFPAARIERSLAPHIGGAELYSLVLKTFDNFVDAAATGLPKLGGSWMAAFFLVSLLVPFQDPRRGKLRWLAAGMAAALAVAQSASRTDSSRVAPEANAENLLILVAPLAFLLGALVVEGLLASREFAFPLLGRFAYVAVGVMLTMQLSVSTVTDVFSLMGVIGRRQLPLVDPPYRPDLIRMLCDTSPENSLIMTDMPWAVSWYGYRPAVWTTLRVQDDFKDDFFAIHVYQRPVWAVYLSPLTANAPMKDKFVSDPDFAWGRFYLDVFLRRNIPTGFPLTQVYGDGLMGLGHFFVASQDTWSEKRK